jgi:hypothetical protein
MPRNNLTKMKCETCERKLQVGPGTISAQCNVCLAGQSALKHQEAEARRPVEEDTDE